ncbi:tryptophan synthase subunit alpha [Bacillus spongiae]|uniref:Tryptophan synthase alpha chain n=1 Tax=Bacillus spongiae TaxID=2683610 RepID=A0ABU8HH76_9BACI
MSKLHQTLQLAKERKEKIFVPYIMAGDGGLHTLGEKITFLESVGATAIEIGIPFSDPVADGPTIQKAGMRALNEGVSLEDILEELSTIRKKTNIPFIIMSYINPIFSYGIEKFQAKCHEAGVSGVIIPDVPLEEMELLNSIYMDEEISIIQLVSLTTPTERVKKIAQTSQGFLYAVTVTGITGERKEFSDQLNSFLELLKANSSVPVLAGFGISSREQIEEMNELCDGVIVGSKIVQSFHENKLQDIEQLTKVTTN